MHNVKKDIGPNLEIRHFHLSDLEMLVRSLTKNSEHIAEYLGAGQSFDVFTLYDFKLLIRQYIKNSDPYEYFGTFYRGELVGMGMLSPGSFQFGAQLVYWVDKDHQHQGVATKIVDTLTEHCFKVGYWNVEVQTDQTNKGSQRVLEKCGFAHVDQYSCEPSSKKDSGLMYVWFKYNPYKRSPFGPKRRTPNLWNRVMVIPR